MPDLKIPSKINESSARCTLKTMGVDTDTVHMGTSQTGLQPDPTEFSGASSTEENFTLLDQARGVIDHGNRSFYRPTASGEITSETVTARTGKPGESLTEKSVGLSADGHMRVSVDTRSGAFLDKVGIAAADVDLNQGTIKDAPTSMHGGDQATNEMASDMATNLAHKVKRCFTPGSP